MILQTGGLAFGEISTRSSPAISASSIARSGVTTPSFFAFRPNQADVTAANAFVDAWAGGRAVAARYVVCVLWSSILGRFYLLA